MRGSTHEAAEGDWSLASDWSQEGDWCYASIASVKEAWISTGVQGACFGISG